LKKVICRGSEIIYKGSLRGAKPLLKENLPLPLIKGKGIGLPDKSLRG
jgi:hypothetical protein